MKEMIERLIRHGYAYAGVNEEGETYVSWDEDIKNSFCVPSCLFPDLEIGRQVELKTLLADDIEELKEQETIKDYIASNLDFLIRVDDNLNNNQDGVVFLANDKGDDYLPIADNNVLAKYAPKKYEKVYLKSLLKKRKVKKSVWFAVDDDGEECFFIEKPKRGESNKGWIGILSDLYEDATEKPIKLTYKVKE